MVNLLEDFKKGPLDYYRNKASFNWKKFKLFLETEDVINYQVSKKLFVINMYIELHKI